MNLLEASKITQGELMTSTLRQHIDRKKLILPVIFLFYYSAFFAMWYIQFKSKATK